jgi:hypothetical protein
MQFRNILLFLAVSLVASAPIDPKNREDPESSNFSKSIHSAFGGSIKHVSGFFQSSGQTQASPSSFAVASFFTGVGLVILG